MTKYLETKKNSLEDAVLRMKEKLVGGQKKLDKDKDGDIDGKDFAILRKQAKNKKEKSEAAKPDFLDLDKDGDKKEPMKVAAKQAKAKKEEVELDEYTLTKLDKMMGIKKGDRVFFVSGSNAEGNVYAQNEKEAIKKAKQKGIRGRISVRDKGEYKGQPSLESNELDENFIKLDEMPFVVGKMNMPKMKGGMKLKSNTNFDFRLFDNEDSPGSDKANADMNKEIVKASKMKDKEAAMAHMNKIQRKHSRHGATDTEPREVISQVLNRVFGESTELGEAKFQVNYSKGGKLFSKTINAKDEDDAEEKAIKQFKIDDDDIRSVVKESLDETVLDTVLSISKGGSRYKDQEKDKDGKFIVKDRLGKVITSLSPSGAKKFLDSLKDPISGKGSVDALKKDRERRASGDSGGMGVRTRGAPEKNIVDLLRKFKEEVELDEVIPKSTMYALVKDGKVIAKGSKRDMTSKKKKEGGTVYNAPSKKVGDTIKEGYESEVLDVLSNADIDGYFKNNKLYISRRDASDAKKALEDADNITKLPKMVMEALDKEDEPKVKQIVKKLKKASQAHAGQATDLEKAISEDGHTDVASAIRQCKTVLEDSMQMLQKLKSMSPEDSLPSWWTNKLAVASNNMNKMRDYLLVPSMSEKTDKNNK